MLLDPISFEPPDWQKPLTVERLGSAGWFERLCGPDGDGVYPTIPSRVAGEPREAYGESQ